MCGRRPATLRGFPPQSSLRSRRKASEEHVLEHTRSRRLLTTASASEGAFLCGLCALCGEFFLRGEGKTRKP